MLLSVFILIAWHLYYTWAVHSLYCQGRTKALVYILVFKDLPQKRFIHNIDKCLKISISMLIILSMYWTYRYLVACSEYCPDILVTRYKC